MAGTKIMIQVQSSGTLIGDHSIWLGERFLKQHKIQAHSSILLRFGSYRSYVTVIPVQHLEGMRMSESLAQKLGLHHNSHVGFSYKAGGRTLALGPLIGVMMTQVYSASDKPFGTNTTFCKELVDSCKALGGFVFFFTTGGIPANNQHLEGWSYSGRWHKTTFPIPDVVYNRLTTRKLENKPSVQHFMREVKQRYGTEVFNEKYLNKTEVFDALRGDPSLGKYLPESHLFKNFAMLKTMSAKYPIVFLKPITGSLGKGIIRITRLNGQSITCHFTNLTGTTRQSYPSLAAAFSAMASKLKQRSYQIQQGLQLIEISGRPVDFRALVQRGQAGEWVVTSTVARIAGSNHFVSNLARGGTLSKVREALAKTNLSAAMQKSVSANLRKAALDIAGGIEKQVKGHFGELGVDLAVDSNGKVWLLEVNSKPSKNDGTPLADGSIRPSVKMTIQYARYLSGF
ncbi:YheC/YheD family endospore coat-associated protein [Paenibacillus koleovorans]|uniref:YheC/YheD family endospore coat-associated protein n=1 Tax=Paenibacillus koleovorans TaxID=121608 RepID=UPI000FD8FC79|nr:YheC/YheD family protein [Paenibacillus koleovorans]